MSCLALLVYRRSVAATEMGLLTLAVYWCVRLRGRHTYTALHKLLAVREGYALEHKCLVMVPRSRRIVVERVNLGLRFCLSSLGSHSLT